MRTVTASWIFLAGAAICGGAGCGGSLSGGTGGSGGGAMAGTSGAAGGFGGYDAGPTGGSPYDGVTTWGNVTVQVGQTLLAPGNLTLMVIDPNFPDQLRTMTYASTTKWNPNDGAYLGVLYTCGSTAVVRVEIYSCAPDGFSGTATPGCIGATFDERGPMGDFMDTDGTRCDISAGSASFHIPPPDFSADPANGTTPYAATGSFRVDCARGDGTHLDLQARFMIPVHTSFLTC